MWPSLQLPGELRQAPLSLFTTPCHLPNGIRAGAHQNTEQSRKQGLVYGCDHQERTRAYYFTMRKLIEGHEDMPCGYQGMNSR